jgi:hypothetical protein
MQSVDAITEQDVRLAFAECNCHDGTSLAAFLFTGDTRVGLRQQRRRRQLAEDALRAMECRGLLHRLVASYMKRFNQ